MTTIVLVLEGGGVGVGTGVGTGAGTGVGTGVGTSVGVGVGTGTGVGVGTGTGAGTLGPPKNDAGRSKLICPPYSISPLPAKLPDGET